MRLRYRVLSDGSTRLDGLDFDTLRVVVYDPVRDQARFEFALPATVPVRLEVFDLHGRRVATLVDAPLPAGRHTRTWNARDAAGRPAAAGVYLARLGAEGTVVRRFVVLR